MEQNFHIKRRKKMIEVSIPLESINQASVREKGIRHGHPNNLHLWWARRPLAATRAIIFCQLVDDPSSIPEEFPSEESQDLERKRLHTLVSKIIKWESFLDSNLLKQAKIEIEKTWRRCCKDNCNHPEAEQLFNPDNPPSFHDPFAGGGAIPIEAQRLGLDSYGSDLNPVSVLINKALLEIPPKYKDLAPVNPVELKKNELLKHNWKGLEGLTSDIKYYGKWMIEEAKKSIGNLYPEILITDEMLEDRPDLKPYLGKKLKVIAWIWTRTVMSPNPSFSQIHIPLASTFLLSSRSGKEAYIQPIIYKDGYKFVVKNGKPENYEEIKKGTKLARGAKFKCLMSGTPIESNYVKNEGREGRMRHKLMAIVVQGEKKRLYLNPLSEHENIANNITPQWLPTTPIGNDPRALWTPPYGLKMHGDLYTKRQLVTLTKLCDLISEVQMKIDKDISEINCSDKNSSHSENISYSSYGKDVCLYLAFKVSKLADLNNSLTPWGHIQECPLHLFSRHAIPMAWDFSEANPFSGSSGSWDVISRGIENSLESIAPTRNSKKDYVYQLDAVSQNLSAGKIVSTDPPYYDNIGYADLSDFFYVWLRRALRANYPNLLATIAVPKVEELVAIPYRHGDKDKAEKFFLDGMSKFMRNLSENSNENYPITIYYAFKQSETKGTKTAVSTGWQIFLSAVIQSGFSILGTWPIRTERKERSIGQGTNALASSVVLVCQPKKSNLPSLTRNEFKRKLRTELPKSIKALERGNIAPVDLRQAVIGPGIAIFSQAKEVINPDDSFLNVRDALVEINIALDEYLSENDGDLDNDSRFALTFFENFGYEERDYGDAEGLARAMNISVKGVVSAGILLAREGKARLIPRNQLDHSWNPSLDNRLTVWEATQHLIFKLESEGEFASAKLLSELNQIADQDNLPANCLALAYRLFNHCEKKKEFEEAKSYNGLVIAWSELEKLALSFVVKVDSQKTLF